MKRRILSMIIAALMSMPFTAPADSGDIYYSDDFSEYAENAVSFGNIAVQSGVDTRVIKDNGNKVLFSRAYGDSARIKLKLREAESRKSVFSALVKIKGDSKSGKLFTFESGGAKYDLLKADKNGTLTLSDGFIVGGISSSLYTLVTIAVNWETLKYNVFIGEKNAAKDWSLPAGLTSYPDSISWCADYIGEGETDLYIDNIRIYEGDTLPWNRSFPVSAENNEVLDFTETTEINNETIILKDAEFENGTLANVSVIRRSGNIQAETDEDGTGFVHLSADKKTNGGSYFDINDPVIATYSRYVVDVRFKVNMLSGNSSCGLFDAKDANAVWRLGYMIKPGGAIVSRQNGLKIGTYKEGKWVRYSFAYNLSAGNVDIYCDGKYLTSHAVSDSIFPEVFRVDLYNSTGGVHDTSFDWIRIYTGDTLKDDSFFTGAGDNSEIAFNNVKMDPADKLSAALSGKTIFMTNNDTMYIDGKKQSYANESFKPYIINGAFMMPRNMYSLFSFDDVKLDETTGEITVGSRVKMKLNETSYTLDGAAKELNAAPQLFEGTLYFPLRAMAEQLLGKKVSWDNRGMIVVADEEIETEEYHYLDRYISWNDANLIYRYMQFENPEGSEMIKALEERFPQKKHPRILFTDDDINYILDGIETDTEFKKCFDNLIKEADAAVLTDYSETYSAPTEKKQTASRSLLENGMKPIAEAYLLTGNEKYAEKGVEMLLGLCSWTSLDYTTSNLIVGHWAAAVGIGFDSFYNYMYSSAEGRNNIDFIKKKAYELALEPHIQSYGGGTSPHWVTMQDNFSGVCGGAMIELVLSMADEEDIRTESAYLLQNLLRSAEMSVGLSFPNGGYYESVGYTDYMYYNFATALKALKDCCGTLYGLDSAPGASKTGNMFTYLQTTDASFNYHDSGTSTFYNNSIREIFGYLFDDPAQAEKARKQKLAGGHEYDLEAYFYYRKATDGKEVYIDQNDTDMYFYGAESGGFKSSTSVGNPTFVGFHGGWTGIPHDSLDLGEFVFESDNVIWACDLGSDDYSLPDYFSMTEYKYYRKRPEGENCIVLNPKSNGDSYYGQKVGACAKLVKTDMNKPRGAMAAYDLTEAYERDAEKYVRGYYFGDDRNTLTVQDELKLRGDTELYWFMHTAQEIEILSGNKARLKSSDGKTCIADVYCSSDFELKVMDCSYLDGRENTSGEKSRDAFKKLTLYVPHADGNVTISVKLSPETGNYTYSEPKVIPIEQWNVPEGDRIPVPELTALYADGEKLSNIPAGVKSFTVNLPFGTEKVPYIKAEASCGNIEIKQPADLNDSAEIEIRGEGIVPQHIVIKFEVSYDRQIYVTDDLQSTEICVGEKGKQITPVLAAAETVIQEESTPEKMLDGDFGTWGTQDGKNRWFEFDLGEVMDISGISLAFYDGNLRSFVFDILYSEDGTNFKRVWSGMSSGTSNGYESIALPGTVRYIRYIGNGNTGGSNWNSITEFRAYKEG